MVSKMSSDYDFTSFKDDSYYDPSTKSLLHHRKMLNLWDDDLKDDVEKHMPVIINGGVNEAASGVIQDPAGSAIGSSSVGGGGASGAIYDSFDLEPIPWIPPEDSIFNSTNGNGKRVLHTHSPKLKGSPNIHSNRMAAVVSLANSYYHAIVTFNEKAAELGDDGKLLNLVPVSASIFAGRFLRNDLGMGHLDPSFTFLAIALAIGTLIKDKQHVPEMTIYFYDKEVCQRAEEYYVDI